MIIEIIETIHNGVTWYKPRVNGKDCAPIAETYDMAMIIGLGIKYDGRNSQFPKMAARMLNIETAWRE